MELNVAVGNGVGLLLVILFAAATTDAVNRGGREHRDKAVVNKAS